MCIDERGTHLMNSASYDEQRGSENGDGEKGIWRAGADGDG
ncbi:hypothetical protein KDK_57410 [Dictyobacter kobayashii]|uniref:Uncharacterized protein n=1 Tax=Dictyobacter kobayashii TaxID=2014872 RepID=A0A402AS64_9CHLR|nr:hypothetical protein KDK_57410 [Dictyobacter kobayashii]